MQTKRGPRGASEGPPQLWVFPPATCGTSHSLWTCPGMNQSVYNRSLGSISSPRHPGRPESIHFGPKDLGREDLCFASRGRCPQELIGTKGRDTSRGFQNQVIKSENGRPGDARRHAIPRGPLAEEPDPESSVPLSVRNKDPKLSRRDRGTVSPRPPGWPGDTSQHTKIHWDQVFLRDHGF